MREKEDVKEFVGNDVFNFDTYRAVHTEGILAVPEHLLKLNVRIDHLEDHADDECKPVIVVFDAFPSLPPRKSLTLEKYWARGLKVHNFIYLHQKTLT